MQTRPISRLLVPVAIVALLGGATGQVQAAVSPIQSLIVAGSPFSPNGDGHRDTVALRLRLSARATVRVSVANYSGHIVRVLASGRRLSAGTTVFTWNGRDAHRSTVADGAYTFRVSATAGGVTYGAHSAWATKSALVAYAANPGAITVVIDPGHGGPDPGATAYDRTHEKTYNLDISLRLAAMLRGAGVRVVLTHSRDAAANPARIDLDGNGHWTIRDELQARVDIADRARGDVFLVLHNNSSSSSGGHGTETYCRSDRPWGDLSCSLANDIQAETMAALAHFRRGSWAPSNRGVHWYDFYVLSPYSASWPRPRSSLMPAILAESLFVSNPGDLARLKSSTVRQAIAAADYRAVSRWLAARAWGAGYAVSGGASTLEAGASTTFSVKVTNHGMSTLPAAAVVEARAVNAMPFFDGRGERGPLGALTGSTALGTALAPGRSTTVQVEVTAPTVAAADIVDFGLVLPGGVRLADRGAVVAQQPLTVTGGPSPSPSPSPSPAP